MTSRQLEPGDPESNPASRLPGRRASEQSTGRSTNTRGSTGRRPVFSDKSTVSLQGEDRPLPRKPPEPDREVPQDTNKYRKHSTEPKHFTHGPLGQDTAERRTTRSQPPTSQSSQTATDRTGARLQTSPPPSLQETTEKLPTTRTQLSPSQPQQLSKDKNVPKQQLSLSPLLVDFLKIPLRNYKVCERYCKDNPDIWDEDVDELRALSSKFLSEVQDENARRCAERWWIVTNARHRKLDTAEANAYVKSLAKDDEKFQDQLDHIISTLGREVDSASSAALVPSVQGNPQTPSSTVITVRTMKPPPVASAVVPPQGVGISGIRRSTRRASDVSRQSQPNFTPLSTKMSESQYLYRDPESSRALPQTTTLVSRAPINESQDPFHAQDFPDTSVPDPDVDDTVDDNITVHNREVQISGQKAEAGPRPDFFDDYSKYKDILHASFQLRTGREAEVFFVKGRVFAMVWHENAGSLTNPKATEISESLDRPFHRHTRNKDGIVIFSHIRHFVIVKARPRDRYCWALPVNTYGGHGLSKKNMRNEEKQAHAIIHASDQDPVRIKGEVKLNKQPISVEVAEGEKIKPGSRLHFGKMQSIEWNIKVKNVGMIINKVAVQRLTLYFNQEFRKGDDTGNETETGPNQGSGAPQQRQGVVKRPP